MPDHPMTPHPFREALEAYATANYMWGIALERHDIMAAKKAASESDAARLEVERLYAARVGEEYEVQVIRSEYDFVGVVLDDDKYSPGDRVFVTKGEAG